MNIVEAKLMAIWCAAVISGPSVPIRIETALNSPASAVIVTAIGTPSRAASVTTASLIAVVRFVEKPDAIIGPEHAQILAGNSIGAIFKAKGWAIHKETLHIGSAGSDADNSHLTSLMRLQPGREVARSACPTRLGHLLDPGPTPDLLGLAIGLGLDSLELPIHVAKDLGPLTLTLGSETIGDPLPLRDHSSMDILQDLLAVIDPFELNVQDLDTEVGSSVLACHQNLFSDRLTSDLDLRELSGYPRSRLVFLRHSICRSNDFDQFVIGDSFTGFAVENIVESRLSTPLIAKTLEKQQRVADTPASIGIDLDKNLVSRR